MRYLPHTTKDLKVMMKAVGVKKIDELFESIPEDVQFDTPINIPKGISEPELLKHIQKLAEKNTTTAEVASFLGAGAYNHYIPAVIDSIVSRSEFFTAYTPYQAEISQGTLQAIFEYQTLICSLLSMDISNASMYDGATALAEAMWMIRRISNKKKILISSNIHPQYINVVKTYSEPFLDNIEFLPFDQNTGLVNEELLEKQFSDDFAAFVVQSPNFFGGIEDLDKLSNIIHKKRALFVVAFTEPTSFGLFNPPGYYGADIVVGEGQSLGMPLSFGGPHLGIFTSRGQYVRSIPGRLVGKTVDKKGESGYVLTLATREQHIRRERATSNICSNHSLNALISAIYLTVMGPEGIKKIAGINYKLSQLLKKELTSIKGVSCKFDSINFNEFVIKTPIKADDLITAGIEQNIIPGLALDRFFPEMENCFLVSVTEQNSLEDIKNLVNFMKKNI